jgi:hypothetical protein
MNVNLRVVSEIEQASGSGFGRSTGGSIMERRRLIGQSTHSLFQTIPPERVGLQGEYDHQGLVKRVLCAFQQNCDYSEIGQLKVSQRGDVVVIMGAISSQRLLIKLVNLAMATPGAGDVEVNGISVGYGLKNYLELKPSQAALTKFKPLITP